MKTGLENIELEMMTAKNSYDFYKIRYEFENIKASPFRVGLRVIYRDREYEIAKVYSESKCATSCKAFPINKDGSVSQTRDVAIYSDVSTFAIKHGRLVEGWEPAPQWAKDAKEDDRKREAR